MMQEESLFNLKAVIQQTGLKPDTLRAWERRYGLPTPERSGGGHRLYSPHDVEMVKWLMARQHEGLSIQRAANLWRQIEAEGRDPLQAAMPSAPQTVYVPAPGTSGATVDQHRGDWIEVCLAFDEQRAEQIVTEAFALYPPEMVVLEVLQQGVAILGEAWYQGEVTVQQEHYCSSLVVRRLESLILGTPPPNRPGRILIACSPGELHTISLLVLTLLLRRRGWDVVYLGADVPLERLGATVRATRPTLVILAAQQLHTAAMLLEAAQLLKAEGIPLAYGGLIFNSIPELRNRIPGDFLGEGLAMAPQGVETLMIAPHPASAMQAIPEAYQRARDHFRERQGLIDALVAQVLHSKGISPSILTMANRGLGLNIDAALVLGDMRFLGADIEWLKGLTKHHHMPEEALCTYFKVYYQIARDQLDKRGELILSWLGTMVDSSWLDRGC